MDQILVRNGMENESIWRGMIRMLKTKLLFEPFLKPKKILQKPKNSGEQEFNSSLFPPYCNPFRLLYIPGRLQSATFATAKLMQVIHIENLHEIAATQPVSIR